MYIMNAMVPGSVKLKGGELYHRHSLNCQYMMRLESDKLLLNFYNEAGLITDSLPAHTLPKGIYTGWESPTCQLRGHFLGHYLSACAWAWAYHGNAELKGRGDHIVKELRRCQLEHGDGWVFSIPREYLHWVARKKRVWAPQYTIHKTLMGLMDMVRFADSELALTVLIDAAEWFYNWSGGYTQEEFDTICDTETGGMLEVFADLYAITGDEKHRTLMDRYYRRHLFDPMMEGKDVLSNMHANTTIPEVLGVARAYEVTGDEKYLDVVKAYWDMAVTDRGYFVTGGQTCYEAWTPPFAFADRLNEENQEHCVVYNMIRLAEFLYKVTGNIGYHAYIERNYRNGILAQQHPETGMVGYYLPMHPGGQVVWGKETENFWCCHGTLVQTHMVHSEGVVYHDDKGIRIMQYRPVEAVMPLSQGQVRLSITETALNPFSGACPDTEAIKRSVTPFFGQRYTVEISMDEPAEFTLTMRIPDWVENQATVWIGDEVLTCPAEAGVIEIRRAWRNEKLVVSFPAAITAHRLPDDDCLVAFMDGSDVLIGLTENNAFLVNDVSENPADWIDRESRSAYLNQKIVYRTKEQPVNFQLIRLKDLGDEKYTLYFKLTQK